MENFLKLTGTNFIMGLTEGQYDGHAHVFRANLPMITNRRYTPNYDASLENLSDHLRSNELNGALLVQPSFLGTDNSFLAKTLEEAKNQPGLLYRGVAALSPNASDAEIAYLNEVGCVGFRLNLVGLENEFDISQWVNVLKKIDRIGWHVELHCAGNSLSKILPTLFKHCRCVVVDHFGLVGSDTLPTNLGLATLLSSPADQLFVKTSAPYRAFPNASQENIAALSSKVFEILLSHLGSTNLIWGSDWPWTQFENNHTYSDTRLWEKHWKTASILAS